MKKLLSVLLIAAMLLSITACAGGETAKAEYKAALLLNGNLGVERKQRKQRLKCYKFCYLVINYYFIPCYKLPHRSMAH